MANVMMPGARKGLGTDIGGGGGGADRPMPRFKPVGPARPMEPLAQPSAFKRGGKVKKTGWAKVHKGEKITPAARALGAGSKAKIAAAGREIKKNPPRVLAKTRAKSGAKRAKKQKVAIMLSKARAAGANIPKK